MCNRKFIIIDKKNGPIWNIPRLKGTALSDPKNIAYHTIKSGRVLKILTNCGHILDRVRNNTGSLGDKVVGIVQDKLGAAGL